MFEVMREPKEVEHAELDTPTRYTQLRTSVVGPVKLCYIKYIILIKIFYKIDQNYHE